MRFTLGILILAQAFAQSSPDPAVLLAGQEQELQRHHSYQFTEETTMNINIPGVPMPPVKYSTVTQALNPGKLRTESTISGTVSVISVSSGDETWTYMPALNQYTRTKDAGAASSMADAMAMPDMSAITASAQVTGSELLEADGEQRDCWVVESRMKDGGSAAFDADTALGRIALREGSLTQARQYLLDAAKTPASSDFEPFGPDFTLARELLAHGERDAVIEFLTARRGWTK